MNTKSKILVGLATLLAGITWQACDTRVPTPITPPEVNYTLHLTSDRYQILADNGGTVARLTAQLTNDMGEPISGATINFSAFQGLISGSVNTDLSGRAKATFFDDGTPADSALIVARYSDGNGNTVRDTVYLSI